MLKKRKNGIIIGLISIIVVTLIVVMFRLFISSISQKPESLPKKKKENPIMQTNKSKPRIFITEFTNGLEDIIVGSIYHVSIGEQDTDDINGMYKSNEFEITNNTIMAKREFAGKRGTIFYLVNGKKIDSLKIQIRDSI